MLGTSSTQRWVDATVPAGTVEASYPIRGRRSGKDGGWSNPGGLPFKPGQAGTRGGLQVAAWASLEEEKASGTPGRDAADRGWLAALSRAVRGFLSREPGCARKRVEGRPGFREQGCVASGVSKAAYSQSGLLLAAPESVARRAALPLRVLGAPVPDAGPALRDAAGRSVHYLRLSVTGNCSMRCGYCRPGVDANRPEPGRLDADGIRFLVGHLHGRFGLRKVRLTGGEPTTRRDLPALVAAVRDGGVDEVAITTNGLTLTRDARRLADAGLSRANVSLDTLDAGRFETLTGVNGLERVLRGIDAAQEELPGGVKLNAVVIAGHNDGDDLLALARYAAGRDLPLRFIELMPMGPLAGAWAGRYVPAAAMKATLRAAGVRLDALPETADAARRFRAELPAAPGETAAVAELGFITPMSCNFCAACDRLRVSADGDLHPCLMDAARGNVAGAIRNRDAAEVDRLLAAAFDQKAAEHPAAGPAIMTRMGG